MTQEERQLLIKDLCSRLPYKPIVTNPRFNDEKYPTTLSPYSLVIGKYLDSAYIDDTKIYLRPILSMSEEEFSEYQNARNGKYHDEIDWLNAHHFDYRGLIEKGLALAAPEGMYKI